ncbi:Transmembrane protein 247 [Galemys pyrenaicus]|uniref:Transmembrane protein 247 n=1 Tax=Galemys pyrenaicus TaxID=202257 RepID=A0A8J5ZTP7_GALPY|nr:Transmembrane protein 247 [Galemys pyrenaicus]
MEMIEARGAGESCPPFPKIVPDNPMSEGKSRASLENVREGSGRGSTVVTPQHPLSPFPPQDAEPLKPDSSYDYLEEMETCEDRGCPGPPKSLSPKAGSTTKGQAGDGPQLTLTETPAAPEAPGNPQTERSAEMELEKVRMEFELTRLKYVHEENERQRQHEEVMEQLQQQATPRLFSGGLQDLLLPQNQFAMFLYCFIFIHIIYCLALSITGNLCTTGALGPDPSSPQPHSTHPSNPFPPSAPLHQNTLSGKKRLCSQPFTLV